MSRFEAGALLRRFFFRDPGPLPSPSPARRTSRTPCGRLHARRAEKSPSCIVPPFFCFRPAPGQSRRWEEPGLPCPGTNCSISKVVLPWPRPPLTNYAPRPAGPHLMLNGYSVFEKIRRSSKSSGAVEIEKAARPLPPSTSAGATLTNACSVNPSTRRRRTRPCGQWKNVPVSPPERLSAWRARGPSEPADVTTVFPTVPETRESVRPVGSILPGDPLKERGGHPSCFFIFLFSEGRWSWPPPPRAREDP